MYNYCYPSLDIDNDGKKLSPSIETKYDLTNFKDNADFLLTLGTKIHHKMKFDDFIIKHAQFLQEKLLKSSETLRNLKKRKLTAKVISVDEQQKRPKALKTPSRPVENWDGKAGAQKNYTDDFNVDVRFEDQSIDEFAMSQFSHHLNESSMTLIGKIYHSKCIHLIVSHSACLIFNTKLIFLFQIMQIMNRV